MNPVIETFTKAKDCNLEGKNIFVLEGDIMVELGLFKKVIGVLNRAVVEACGGVAYIENCYLKKDVSYETKAEQKEPDAVNNPNHYTQYAVEVVDMTDSILATIKDPLYAAYFKTIYEYISRAHLKNGTEDIKKAQWWLNRLINKIDAGEVAVK